MSFFSWNWLRRNSNLEKAVRRLNDAWSYDEKLVSNVVKYGNNAIPELLRQLDGSAPPFHYENVFQAFARIGDKRAIPALLNLDTSWKYRLYALEALKTWRDDLEVKQEILNFEHQIQTEMQGIYIVVTGMARKKLSSNTACVVNGKFVGRTPPTYTRLDFPDFWISNKENHSLQTIKLSRNEITSVDDKIEQKLDGVNTDYLEQILAEKESLDFDVIESSNCPHTSISPQNSEFLQAYSDRSYSEILYIDPEIPAPSTPFFITATKMFLQPRKWRCAITISVRKFNEYPYILERLDNWKRNLPESPNLEMLGDRRIEIQDGWQFPLNLVDNLYCPILATVEQRTGEYSYIVELLQADNLSGDAPIQSGCVLGISKINIKWRPYVTQIRQYDFAIVDSVLSLELV